MIDGSNYDKNIYLTLDSPITGGIRFNISLKLKEKYLWK